MINYMDLAWITNFVHKMQSSRSKELVKVIMNLANLAEYQPTYENDKITGTLRHTRHNLVGQCKIVVHKYNQVLPCDVLIVTVENNDAYSHSNLYYV